MRIGLVLESNLCIPGGVQEYTRGLHDFLAEAGHEVEIIACGRAGVEDRRRKVVLLAGSREMVLPGSSASIPLTLFRPGAIRTYFERNHFDILHFQGPGGFFSRSIITRSRAANVLTFHVYQEGPRAWAAVPFWPFWRSQSPRLSARIAHSRATLPLARSFYPGSWEVLPGGLDRARFTPRGDSLSGYRDEKVNCLFVGRLDRRKGVIHLLEAMRRLPPHPPVRLLIVGDGPERSKAERIVRRKNLPEVVFFGRVGGDVLPAIYRTADIFCAPSTHGESLGIVLLEAMASGLPVVAFANAGYAEVLGGSAGRDFLVRPGDVEGLASKLRLLIEDRGRRTSLGRALAVDAVKYSWTAVGPRIVDIYRRSLHGPEKSEEIPAKPGGPAESGGA